MGVAWRSGLIGLISAVCCAPGISAAKPAPQQLFWQGTLEDEITHQQFADPAMTQHLEYTEKLEVQNLVLLPDGPGKWFLARANASFVGGNPRAEEVTNGGPTCISEYAIDSSLATRGSLLILPTGKWGLVVNVPETVTNSCDNSGTHKIENTYAYAVTGMQRDSAGHIWWLDLSDFVHLASTNPYVASTDHRVSGNILTADVSDLEVRPSAFPTTGGSGLGSNADVSRANGTTISYRMSEPGSLTFTVLRCGRRCKPVGHMTRDTKAGRSSFHWDGHVNGHRLELGSYQLQAVPLLQGHKGLPVNAAFRIIK